MAEVKITPQIECDSCGERQELFLRDAGFTGQKYVKPRDWGSCHMTGPRQDAYGINEEIKMTDLCPRCALVAINAVYRALKAARGEDDGT